MNRIVDQLERRRGKGAVMPFVCGGHPKPDSLPRLLPALEHAGASVVEIGIPYSDPIADGPVIAGAMHRALEQGVTPAQIFEQVRSVRANLSIGLVAMVSVSIIHAWGGSAGFCERAKDAGFDGLIVPDLPVEESEPVRQAAREQGLCMSLLISPSTTRKRAERIARASSGFVYLMARLGITGEREESPEIARKVEVIRKVTQTPIACGFGLSTPDQVRRVLHLADAAIVGSALVRRLEHAEDPAATARAFVGELVEACEDRSQSTDQNLPDQVDS